jgi:hypothetical protein
MAARPDLVGMLLGGSLDGGFFSVLMGIRHANLPVDEGVWDTFRIAE